MLLLTSSQLPVASRFFRYTLLKQDHTVSPDISTKTLTPDPGSLTPHINLKTEIRKLKSEASTKSITYHVGKRLMSNIPFFADNRQQTFYIYVYDYCVYKEVMCHKNLKLTGNSGSARTDDKFGFFENKHITVKLCCQSKGEKNGKQKNFGSNAGNNAGIRGGSGWL
jgi:hypothetical protein